MDFPSVFDLSGKFLFKWGNKGYGDGEFNGPSGIAFDSNDNAFVADQFNHRIQKYDSSGKFILQWGSKGDSIGQFNICLLYTSPSPRDATLSRMPSSA